jgi:hypothetical protein
MPPSALAAPGVAQPAPGFHPAGAAPFPTTRYTARHRHEDHALPETRPAAALQEIGTPALFVLLWSTGFIGAKLGLPYAPPLTFLTLRFVLVAALLVLLSLATRAPWPRRRDVPAYALAGLLVHGVYLGGVFVGIGLGVEAGVSALIVSVQERSGRSWSPPSLAWRWASA